MGRNYISENITRVLMKRTIKPVLLFIICMLRILEINGKGSSCSERQTNLAVPGLMQEFLITR